METLISQRGKRLILYDDFKFRKSRKTLDGWLWRCTKKTCKSTLRLDDSERVVLRSEINHNHEPTRTSQRQQREQPALEPSWLPLREETFLEWVSLLNPYYFHSCCQSQDVVPFMSSFNDFIRFLFLDKNMGKHFLLPDEESLNFGIDLSLSNS